jgi:hypothetical protein
MQWVVFPRVLLAVQLLQTVLSHKFCHLRCLQGSLCSAAVARRTGAMGDHKVKRTRGRDNHSYSKHLKQATIASGASTPTDEDVTVPKSVLKFKDDCIPAANGKVRDSSRIT